MYTSFSMTEPIGQASKYTAEPSYEPMKIWHVNLIGGYDKFTSAAYCRVTITPPEGPNIQRIINVSTDLESWELQLLYEVVHFIYKYNKGSGAVPTFVCDILRSQGIDMPGEAPKYDYVQDYEYDFTSTGAESYETVVLDTLKDLVDLEQKIRVTCCKTTAVKLPLRRLVIHWNDSHKYSLLEIADRLEALDADIELKPKELT